MKKNKDATVTLTQDEIISLQRVISACHHTISRFASDGDILGWDNYRALQMWDDKLKGETYDLTDYIEEDEQEDEDEDEDMPLKPKTVDAWLYDYGKQVNRK